jgi:hypothetical protein
MTSQAILRARFSELAESLGITLSVRRQTNKYYFTVAGGWKNTNTFLQTSFPNAWITSAGGGEFTYGLPLADVERVLADALEEGGCNHAEILNHCRTSAPHQQTCWVVELLLGPERKRRRKSPPAREAEAES